MPSLPWSDYLNGEFDDDQYVFLPTSEDKAENVSWAPADTIVEAPSSSGSPGPQVGRSSINLCGLF